MVKFIVHVTSVVFHWGHIFLESKCLHLQGAFNNCLHKCKGVKKCICFNTERTRYVWIPVLFSVLITNGSNEVVCHFSIKDKMQLQPPVQNTSFTGLCFRLWLKSFWICSPLPHRCFCSPFVSLWVMHSMPALLFDEKSPSLSECLRKCPFEKRPEQILAALSPGFAMCYLC